MKLFIIVAVIAIVAVAVQAVTDEQKAKAAEHVKVCSGEANVLPADLAAAKTNPNVDIKDPKWQKFAKCFFEKAGFLDAKGDFNEKVAIEKLSVGVTDKSKVEQLVKLCQKDLSTDKNEIPLQLYKCYNQHKALSV